MNEKGQLFFSERFWSINLEEMKGQRNHHENGYYRSLMNAKISGWNFKEKQDICIVSKISLQKLLITVV